MKCRMIFNGKAAPKPAPNQAQAKNAKEPKEPVKKAASLNHAAFLTRLVRGSTNIIAFENI